MLKSGKRRQIVRLHGNSAETMETNVNEPISTIQIPEQDDAAGIYRTIRTPERLLTLREVASALSVPLFAVRRAARSGEFPTYRIGNGRARVRMSDVLHAVDSSKEESAQ